MTQWLTCFLIAIALFTFQQKFLSKAASLIGISLISVGVLQIQFVAVEGWKIPQQMEIKRVNAYLTLEKCNEASYVKSSLWSDLRPIKVSHDEFGIPSTFPSWATSSYANFYCMQIGADSKKFTLIDRENETYSSQKVLDFHLILREKNKQSNLRLRILFKRRLP